LRVLTVDPHELEQHAKRKLSLNGWNYAASNAGSSLTDRANREAFYRHRIIPRMLRDTNQRDTTIELFGHKISAPILFSPIGINKIYHPDGELAVAKVAGPLELSYLIRRRT
jgi:isopentenyl diphosphate isomerase/L-lactate dehydrogenase-like FMN-dependent dehydrogenase